MFVTLSHATIKTEKGEPAKVDVFAAHVFGVFESPSLKARHVLSTGGAIIPCLETRDQVLRMVSEKLNEKEKVPYGKTSKKVR